MNAAPLSPARPRNTTFATTFHKELSLNPITSVTTRSLLAVLCAFGFAQGALAAVVPDGDGFSIECGDYDANRKAYFGDTHVHTIFSADAYIQGTDTTPDQAYQFAKGALIGLHPFDESGEPTRSAQIDRPLDFAVVTDHA